jgi:UDP-N-acetylmuramate--alanine ligase
MAAARALGVARQTRPALLAEVIGAGQPGVAIAGTSGKSTVTGMVGWILRRAGAPATVLGGAPLAGEGSGFSPGDDRAPVVAEACESDGTLVGYRPGLGLIHNVTRDHQEVDALRAQFDAFAAQCHRLLGNAACPEAARIARDRGGHAHGLTYGLAPDADVPLRILELAPERAIGELDLPGGALRLDLPHPGAHNLENAAAAALVAHELGIAPGAIADALSCFPGMSRRFEVVGTTADGIRVVDDYAHNGAKIRAAVAAAQARPGRLLAIFQPHGYGPARFLRPELARLWPEILRPGDRLCYGPIFYAGGTVTRDVSSEALAGDLPAALGCACAADHAAIARWAASEARPGDTVLAMGARDPALGALARAILAAVSARAR